MSDLSLEDQNEAERQTELIATNADLGRNQLKRFANAIVLLIRPASPSNGNFHALQGVAGGHGVGTPGRGSQRLRCSRTQREQCRCSRTL